MEMIKSQKMSQIMAIKFRARYFLIFYNLQG